jgi:hypothetical protein
MGLKYKKRTGTPLFFIVVDSSITFWNRFALECNQLSEILKAGEKERMEPSYFSLG